jgi:DNA-binding transcriptional regulator YiaG
LVFPDRNKKRVLLQKYLTGRPSVCRKLKAQEATVKIDVQAYEALVRLQRELCAFEKQVHTLCGSFQEVIAATSEMRPDALPRQRESEIAVRIVEGVISRLKITTPTATRREKYLREREVAEYMGVNVATLRAWRLRRSKNGPPFSRLGRVIMYSFVDLEKHMAAHVIPHRE